MAIYPTKFSSDSSLKPKSVKGANKMACKGKSTKKSSPKKCGTKKGGK